MPDTSTRSWWGDFALQVGTCGRWEVGPLTIWVERNREDWTVVREREDDPFRDRSAVTIPASTPTATQGEVHRFAAAEGSTKLYVLPAHADRPVVITPERPFTLPPKRTAHLFVSLPLWFQLRDEITAKPLLDEAVVRPSDTWHGPNTRSGQLCYASRTRASFEPSRRLPQRIVTPFEVRNHGESDLAIERIKLPTPHLSVLRDGHGELWTETVIFEKPSGTEPPDVRIETDMKRGKGRLEILNGPRTRAEKKFVWHAFGELFGTGW